MRRVYVAECKQEVSSFNPLPSTLADFRIVRGVELIEHHRKVREEMGGALRVLENAEGLQVVPGWGGSSITSGGILTAADFRQLADDFLGSLAEAQRREPLDAAYFSMHGAMQADGEDDPEGYLLQGARQILGDALPIVVSLDLHGILTDRMLAASDAVVPYHTYPHVDFFETGERAARLLLKILTRGARPVTARVKIPALVRGDELITDTGAIGYCIRFAQQIEAMPNGLSAGVMWGNPFTDVPELCTSSVVVMDGDESSARQLALELADVFWKHHEKMQVPLVSLDAAVAEAASVSSGTVVMMDAADATSSGASGDSNWILREVLRQGYRGKVLVPLIDPGAARAAFAAGVGGSFKATLGGAFDSARHRPLQLDVRVRMLSDGQFRSESFGWPWNSGPTAVLQSDNITVIVGSRPVSLFDRSWFYAHGQDPRRFDLVVVKSPHCEQHMFADWCARLIHVDAPGSTSANLKSLGHQRCARPMFPLDENVAFLPAPSVFSRQWKALQLES